MSKKTTKKKTTKKTAKKTAKKTTAVAAKRTGTVARWGSYETWSVTANQIHLFDDVSMSREWEDAKTTGSGKKKKTTKAHAAPIEFDFTFTYYKDFYRSIDIAAKIRTWNSRIGKAAAFYIGTTAFGAAKKYRLTGVNVTDVRQVAGVISQCTIELHFKMTTGNAGMTWGKRAKKTVKKKSTKTKKKAKKKR